MGQELPKTASKPPENGYQCPRTQSYCGKATLSLRVEGTVNSGMVSHVLEVHVYQMTPQGIAAPERMRQNGCKGLDI